MEYVQKLVAWVLKLWHSLFAGPLGLDASTAWVISIVMLVVTIRGLLFPLAYRQYASGRHLVNLRPSLRRLNAEYKGKKDAEARKEKVARERELRRNSDYKMVDGCIPALIQVPLIIALYQLLLRIARPVEGIDAPHQGFGSLTSDDVSHFLDARLFDVPISSYHIMNANTLAELGTTRSSVFWLALPLATCAAIFTTANWAYTMKRNLQTVDHESFAARSFMKLMWVFGPFLFLFPFVFGLLGPAPIAILMYWVCSNLWTAMQTFIIQRTLDRRVPYTTEFREYHAEQKQLYLDRKKDKKFKKAEKRGE